MTMQQTTLITGGAGFIGSCLVRQIIAEEPKARVVTLDKLTYAANLDSLKSALPHPRHEFVTGDVSDSALVKKMIEKVRPSAIVHLAAETHVDRSIDGPAEFLTTNVVGTFTLLEATREYWRNLADGERRRFRFLHVSTDEVYGSLGPTGSFSESTPYAPRSPYSASKASSDHFVRAYHHTYGLPTLITNSSNNFGPFQFPEKLIPLTILNALEGKPLPVYGDGTNVRDWLFVDDHCRALRLVLERAKPGESYNIGANCERTNLETVRGICRVVDQLQQNGPHRPSENLIQFVRDRPGHDHRYSIDAAKIRRELGWTPSKDFDAALEATVRWYAENQGWVNRVTQGTYRRERLGLTEKAA